ncbi:hypothetical protein SEPCBS119000_003287 [Sporothrix epigloea]|uniref:Purine-cytosine permease n=1 Tax=Sporothrix epigloea TaxID=1892477 RepID=A0ABP0DKT2_9PEZI
MSSLDRQGSAQDAYEVDVEKQPAVAGTAGSNAGSNGRRIFGFAGHGLGHSLALEDGEVYKPKPEKNTRWYQRLIDAGFEDNGVKPVPLEERTNTQYSDLFTIFFTSMLSLLPLPTGILGTLTFGLSLRDTSLIIIFFGMLTCIPPAFLSIGGSQTGLRQQIQARYSFGLYFAIIPLLLNAATVTGFTLISAVVSGQTISALNPDRVSVTTGIVIICVVSLLASMLGYRALHFIERWTWIPSIIGLVVAVGCGGKYLHLQAETEPATAYNVLSYAGIIAGFFLTFSGTVSDYSTYHNPSVSNAYAESNIGGIIYEMLTPAKGFGKFVVVLLALSGVGNIAISSYSVSLNLQMIFPFFARIHRVVFVFATLAIMIPFAIMAAKRWEESLTNFLAIIGYWAGCFAAVLLEELIIFRKMDFSTFDHAIWNVGKKLPPGVAAISASILSFGLVVPGMAEVWYTGPIAVHTGDIGFEVAFVVTAIFYIPLRWLEIRWRGHL